MPSSSDPAVTINCVDTRPHRQIVDATVTTDRGTHRIGHLPGHGRDSGWFCSCRLTRTCPSIAQVRALIPGIATDPGGPS